MRGTWQWWHILHLVPWNMQHVLLFYGSWVTATVFISSRKPLLSPCFCIPWVFYEVVLVLVEVKAQRISPEGFLGFGQGSVEQLPSLAAHKSYSRAGLGSCSRNTGLLSLLRMCIKLFPLYWVPAQLNPLSWECLMGSWTGLQLFQSNKMKCCNSEQISLECSKAFISSWLNSKLCRKAELSWISCWISWVLPSCIFTFGL